MTCGHCAHDVTAHADDWGPCARCDCPCFLAVPDAPAEKPKLELTQCASCKAEVVWLTQVTKAGKEQRHIFNAKPELRWVLGPDFKVRSASTYVSHWATCVSREQHRKEW